MAPPVVAVRTPENTIPTVAVPPINATVPTPIAPPTPPLATPPRTAPATDATPPENPITPATPATPSPVALLNGNPLVKQVQALPIDPATTQVIYHLNNTDFFATIIPSGNAGDVVVEAWSRSTGKRAGRTIFAGNPPQPSFAISPSGDLVARIATFPSSSIQIWSYAQNRVTQTLAVDANLGTPRLLGFPSNTSLIWEQRGNTYGAEYFDLTTGKSTTLVDAADKHAGVIAFSPDGKQMAAIVRFVNATNPNVNSTMLFPYNSTGRNNLLTMQRWFLSRNDNGILANPSGIAYSPDGKTIARAYEQTGQLLLVTNRFPDGKQVSSTVIPGGINLDAAQQMNGPEGRMLWLGDAHNAPDILYGGRTFIEISTGKIIGELPLTNVLQQRQISPGHLHLLTSDAVNKTQLLDITLN